MHNNIGMTGSAVTAKLKQGTHALFFRLETNEADHRIRKGPYMGAPVISRTALAEYAEEHSVATGDCTARHPAPWQDTKMARHWKRVFQCHEERDYLFGFDKLSQYHNWFCSAKGLRDIEDQAVLGVYLVPNDRNFIPGQFQAAAHREHMQHVFDLPTTYEYDELGRAIIEYRVDRHASCTAFE